MSTNEKPTPVSIALPRQVQVGERPSASWANNVVDNIVMLRGPQNIGGLRDNTGDLLASMPFAVSMIDPDHVSVLAGHLYSHSITNLAYAGTTSYALPAPSVTTGVLVFEYTWNGNTGDVAFYEDSDAGRLSTSSVLRTPLVALTGYAASWEISQRLRLGDIHVCGPNGAGPLGINAGFRRTSGHPESQCSGTFIFNNYTQFTVAGGLIGTVT